MWCVNSGFSLQCCMCNAAAFMGHACVAPQSYVLLGGASLRILPHKHDQMGGVRLPMDAGLRL